MSAETITVQKARFDELTRLLNEALKIVQGDQK